MWTDSWVKWQKSTSQPRRGSNLGLPIAGRFTTELRSHDRNCVQIFRLSPACQLFFSQWGDPDVWAYGAHQHNWPLFVITTILLSDDASWGIAAKLGTRAIQCRWLHARAMYGCWIMHEKKNADWLTMANGCDYQPISSGRDATVFTVNGHSRSDVA